MFKSYASISNAVCLCPFGSRTAQRRVPEAWSCPQHTWHQPGQGKGTLLNPPRGLPGPGWAPAGHSEGQGICKKRKPLLPMLEISFHPYKCPSLLGSMLVALLARGAGVVPQDIKVAESLLSPADTTRVIPSLPLVLQLPTHAR